ncbi:MAG: hypothetical protein FJX21_15920 [Alphaproteobacteria bacterium]|nr:hypothetical protein [Alphaproteobacteria bacterium]
MNADKIEEIRARHESGASPKSYYTQAAVLEQLNYLHGLDQMHDKDYAWETQLTNIVWWADDLIKDGAPTPSVAPKVWDAFILGDFDTTLAVATDGARVLLEEAIDDRATLLAEVERLRAALRWYADLANHQPIRTVVSGGPDDGTVLVEEPPIAFDGGERARDALEGAP